MSLIECRLVSPLKSEAQSGASILHAKLSAKLWLKLYNAFHFILIKPRNYVANVNIVGKVIISPLTL